MELKIQTRRRLKVPGPQFVAHGLEIFLQSTGLLLRGTLFTLFGTLLGVSWKLLRP